MTMLTIHCLTSCYNQRWNLHPFHQAGKDLRVVELRCTSAPPPHLAAVAFTSVSQKILQSSDITGGSHMLGEQSKKLQCVQPVRYFVFTMIDIGSNN
jgi:hypothetical protein